MADYKIPTPTNKPVPSADIRDVVFAGAKVDEWATSTEGTYVDRFGKRHFTAEGINDQFQQFLLNSGYDPLADYVNGPITFERRNQITAYNGEFYRPKASVTLPYTTTGNTATTWATDEANFVALGDAALRQELAGGTGENVGVYGDKTLAEFSENPQYYAGLNLPTYSDWATGAASTYTTVWKWTDGSFWWGCNGTLPSQPDSYSMRRYDPFGDPVNIQKVLANIFFQDRTGGSTLWSIFLSGITNRVPMSSNATMFSGAGTADSVLSLQPMLTLAGLLTWPDYSLANAPQISTLSTAAAAGYGTFANCWNLSTPSALGVGSDTGACAVWTGVTRAKRLYRLIVTTTGHIFIRVMSADLTWGNSYEVYSTLNTTKASDGTLSAASPIIRVVDTVATSTRTDLTEDTFEAAGDYGVANHEASGCTVTKVSTGTYQITGCTSLAVSGWQVKDPFALQGSIPLGVAEGVTQSDGSVLVYLYKRKLILDSDTSEITETKGDLMDVPAESWIDVRVAMADVTDEDDL